MAIEPQDGRVSKLYSWRDEDVERIKRLRARYRFGSDTDTIRQILIWADSEKPVISIRPQEKSKKSKKGA